MKIEDRTKGYKSGDGCPNPPNPKKCGGLITIRRGEIYENGKKTGYYEYAQCSRCSWNSTR